MNFDLILGFLVRKSLRARLDPLPEEVPLAPIDHAALRHAPAEVPRPAVIEAPEPLPLAA